MTSVVETRYRVGGMDCASCAAKIETAVRRLPHIEDVTVSATAGTLRVRHIDDAAGATLWWVRLTGSLAPGDWVVGCANPGSVPGCDFDLKTLTGVGGGSPPITTTNVLKTGVAALGVYDGGASPGSRQGRIHQVDVGLCVGGQAAQGLLHGRLVTGVPPGGDAVQGSLRGGRAALRHRSVEVGGER